MSIVWSSTTNCYNLGRSVSFWTIRSFRETILRTFCVKIACETDASSFVLRVSGESSNFRKMGFRMVENVGLVQEKSY